MDVNDNFTIDFSLARGLSYYTSSIFEVKSNKSNIGSLCGGGRYDNLTENFGLKDMPGIGISFGIERIFELLKEKKDPVLQDGKNKILLSYLDSRYLPNCLVIAKKLRDEGISVDLISDNLKLKKQLKYANKNNIPFVMIVGEDEIKSNSFTFKSMENGKQEKNSIDEIISTMKSLKSNE
jgi:histidyl-tRNA synthetase